MIKIFLIFLRNKNKNFFLITLFKKLKSKYFSSDNFQPPGTNSGILRLSF